MINAELLKGLTEEESARVLALGKRIVLNAGAELFRLGDEAGNLYVVASGRVRLTLPMQVRSRAEDVLVDERSNGQTVGWSALIPPNRYTLTGTAAMDTEVIELPRAALSRYFDAHPDTGYAVSLNLSAVIGQRLELFQAMWMREVQRMVELRYA